MGSGWRWPICCQSSFWMYLVLSSREELLLNISQLTSIKTYPWWRQSRYIFAYLFFRESLLLLELQWVYPLTSTTMFRDGMNMSAFRGRINYTSKLIGCSLPSSLVSRMDLTNMKSQDYELVDINQGCSRAGSYFSSSCFIFSSNYSHRDMHLATRAEWVKDLAGG